MIVKEFGIKKDMDRKSLLAEIENKISGETSQEVELFLMPSELDGIDTNKVPEIAIDNGEYAVAVTYEAEEVFERSKTLAPIKHISYIGQQIKKVYWFIGINDEQKYFIHRLIDLPEEYLKSIPRILEWVNKADEGFIDRLQGDILIKFIRDSVNNMNDGKMHDVIQGKMLVRHGRHDKWHIDDGQRTEVSVDGTYSKIKLGNHVISTNGFMMVIDDQYLVCFANVADAQTSLVLQHREHGYETIQLPLGHAAVFTGQRGRGLRTSDGVRVSIANNVGFD